VIIGRVRGYTPDLSVSGISKVSVS